MFIPALFTITKIYLSFFFKKHSLLITLLQLSYFPPFVPLCPAHPLLPALLPFSSCPWVVHISSLVSIFPILFLTSPCLFSTYHPFMLLFICTFSPSVSLPLPTPHSTADNLPYDLHFCDSVPVLVVCLVCFCFCFFLGLVVNSYEFVVILLFIFLIFFFLDKSL